MNLNLKACVDDTKQLTCWLTLTLIIIKQLKSLNNLLQFKSHIPNSWTWLLAFQFEQPIHNQHTNPLSDVHQANYVAGKLGISLVMREIACLDRRNYIAVYALLYRHYLGSCSLKGFNYLCGILAWNSCVCRLTLQPLKYYMHV